MEAIKLISMAMGIKAVQWLMLVMIISLLAVGGYLGFKNRGLAISLQLEKAENKALTAATQTQNEAIRQAVNKAEEMFIQVNQAKTESDRIQKNTAAGVAAILKKELKGTCAQMVANSVLLLQGGDL